MTLGAGALDTRCAFEQQVETPDGGGGFSLEWTEQFSRWGAFAFPSLRAQQEAIAGGAVQSTTGGTLTVREDTQTKLITHKWRVVAKGRTWNIREVRPGERTGFLRMSVEAGGPT